MTLWYGQTLWVTVGQTVVFTFCQITRTLISTDLNSLIWANSLSNSWADCWLDFHTSHYLVRLPLFYSKGCKTITVVSTLYLANFGLSTSSSLSATDFLLSPVDKTVDLFFCYLWSLALDLTDELKLCKLDCTRYFWTVPLAPYLIIHLSSRFCPCEKLTSHMLVKWSNVGIRVIRNGSTLSVWHIVIIQSYLANL